MALAVVLAVVLVVILVLVAVLIAVLIVILVLILVIHDRSSKFVLAEMGKGIYGAEAAAQELFNKKASDLTRRESSLLAACLPNPIQRHAENPSSYVSKRAGQIRTLIPKIAYPEWIEHK